MGVFPARAGMSPVCLPCLPTLISVPRASGDEPSLVKRTARLVKCSPRERG